jgi:hypothetical protein
MMHADSTASASVLHIVPGHVDVRPGQGSHKDVGGRKAFLLRRAAAYHYLSVNGDVPAQLDRVPAGFVPTHVLIEYSYFPRIARAIRRRYPAAAIAVRAHNIEPLQHWTLAGPGERDFLMPLLQCAYVTFRLWLADLQIAWLADRIFVIAPAEGPRYWRWLGGRARVSWLPYLPPVELADSGARKERQIVACLPGGAESVRTRDLVDRFSAFARSAAEAGWTERFVVTGDVSGWQIQLDPVVERAGYIDDLPAFYRSIAAVAVLSPLGFGFKTTIGDAVACGAAVLAHPKIRADLPDELKPFAIAVDSLDTASLDRIHGAMRAIPAASGAQAALNERFEREMADFLQAPARGLRAAPS